MKRAVVYARYSCDNQTEQSIEGQLHVCQDYAQRNDIVIVDTYIDRAMTGTNDNRPDFQRMLKDSNRKLWDYVLVYKLDRFSRNKYEASIHKHTLKANGISVISAMENIPDTPEGIILESVIEGMNQYYSLDLSQKVKRGMKETRLKGNFYGGVLIYGYKVQDHKVVINEDEAKIVRFIYEKYSMGVIAKEIIKELTDRGVYRNGKPFCRTSIYNILQNRKYSGIYIHNEEVFDNIYPQIVPTDLFNKVQKIVEENRHGKASVMTNYLLKNKVICGYCGEKMNGQAGTSKSGKVYHFYKCHNRIKKVCDNAPIRQEFLDNVVVDSISKELSKKENLNVIVKRVLKIQESVIETSPVLAYLENDIRETNKALNNILKAIEMGVINRTTNNRMIELEDKLKELNEKVIIEKMKTVQRISEEDIRQFFVNGIKRKSRELVCSLVRIVKVYEDKIEIYFNKPLSADINNDYLLISKFDYKLDYSAIEVNLYI